MTHDELLAKIDYDQEDYYANNRHCNALRAVVELHKPYVRDLHILGNTQICNFCAFLSVGLFGAQTEQLVPYPCPTIQAIEKELK